jgi:hypothetical protein
MTAREKTVLSWLKGTALPENQGKEISEPTPGEVKALLIKLPPELHRRIVSGPNGRQFQNNATEMLRKFAEAEAEAKKAKQKK